jgi:hypothetical protein
MQFCVVVASIGDVRELGNEGSFAHDPRDSSYSPVERLGHWRDMNRVEIVNPPAKSPRRRHKDLDAHAVELGFHCEAEQISLSLTDGSLGCAISEAGIYQQSKPRDQK